MRVYVVLRPLSGEINYLYEYRYKCIIIYIFNEFIILFLVIILVQLVEICVSICVYMWSCVYEIFIR